MKSKVRFELLDLADKIRDVYNFRQKITQFTKDHPKYQLELRTDVLQESFEYLAMSLVYLITNELN